MRTMWMAIEPRPEATRVIAMNDPAETVLKARLAPAPRHARAVPALLEALALWQGAKIRAAVAVDDTDASSVTRLGLDSLADLDAPPLYSLDIVAATRRGRRRRDGLGGLGHFGDLKQLALWEVRR